MIARSAPTSASMLARAAIVAVAFVTGCGDDGNLSGPLPPTLDAAADAACEGAACQDANTPDACAGAACRDASTTDACADDNCADATTGDASACDGPCAPSAFSFTVTPGELEPSFHPLALTYRARIGLFVERVMLTVTTTSGVQAQINGEAVSSGTPWQSPVLNVGDNVVSISVTEAGQPARMYTVTIARGYQEAYLKGATTRVVAEGVDVGNELGARVAISGDTLVVGAPNHASAATGVDGDQSDDSAAGAGAAYVFVRDGDTWSQQAFLKASNAQAEDRFGSSVAISGDTIVVGAPRESSNATGINGDQANNEGTYSGAVYVFVRSGNTWSQQAYLKSMNSGPVDLFGTDVAIESDTVIVGAPQESSSTRSINGASNENALQSGAAYVFVRNGSSWSQQAFIKASNADSEDFFGAQLAFDGQTLLVGATGESAHAAGASSAPNDNSATRSGAAYVFVHNGTAWIEQAYLKANNGHAEDQLGNAVAIDGDTLVIGARNESSRSTGVNGDTDNQDAQSAGAAYLFARSGSTWSQVAYLKASNTSAFDFFGDHVAIAGDRVLVAATWEASSSPGIDASQGDNRAINAGALYVFTRVGTAWQQLAYVKSSNPGPDHYFGPCAIHGDTMVIGAPGETSAAAGINGSQADDGAYRAGAVYVIR